jgi:hypothetical protein
VRDDRVGEREPDAEDEVDPQLRPLGHRAPDDRERDAGEDDLEQVAGRARDLGEELERLLPDRDHRLDRGEEARRADEAVAVAERDPEADGPVDDRRDAEDQHVLAGDVAGVLHPRQARLEEGEAGLHEHDEDGGDDHPDGARRDQQVVLRHWGSSRSGPRKKPAGRLSHGLQRPAVRRVGAAATWPEGARRGGRASSRSSALAPKTGEPRAAAPPPDLTRTRFPGTLWRP